MKVCIFPKVFGFLTEAEIHGFLTQGIAAQFLNMQKENAFNAKDQYY